MENFELIEKYASGRLEGMEKEAFEQQLKADAALRKEVELQQQIIQGVKQARILQLKSMLSQVPVGGSVIQSGITAGNIITGAVAVTALVTVSLIYFKPWEEQPAPATIAKEITAPIDEKVAEVKPEVNSSKEKTEAITPTPEPTKEPAKITKTTPIEKSNPGKPKIEVLDPSEDLTQSQSDGKSTVANQSAVMTSHIAVETESSNEKYSFHYQFNKGKLVLYGSFDKGLYEILEVHGENHSLFLYYKESYYLLNEKAMNITPLTAIKDQQLIKLLKEYRSK
ncbi:MAG: hypothetical protein JSS79_18390 [Bacteroidetes bacterium]|nr:hypothetical protein [Bacteroidota bacterium]